MSTTLPPEPHPLPADLPPDDLPEMQHRVATALCSADGRDPSTLAPLDPAWTRYLQLALAALEEMTKPTVAMLKVGDAVAEWDDDAAEIWRAMMACAITGQRRA